MQAACSRPMGERKRRTRKGRKGGITWLPLQALTTEHPSSCLKRALYFRGAEGEEGRESLIKDLNSLRRTQEAAARGSERRQRRRFLDV